MRRASPRPKPRRSGESRLLWAAFALAQVGLAWSPVEAAFARACSVSVNMRLALALALLRQGLTLRKTKEGEPERRRETERESERGGEAEGPRYTASSTLSWTRLEQMDLRLRKQTKWPHWAPKYRSTDMGARLFQKHHRAQASMPRSSARREGTSRSPRCTLHFACGAPWRAFCKSHTLKRLPHCPGTCPRL